MTPFEIKQLALVKDSNLSKFKKAYEMPKLCASWFIEFVHYF